MIMIMTKLLIRQDGGQGHGRQDIRAEGREGAGLGEESQDRFVLFLVVVFKEGVTYLLREDVQRKTIQDVQVGFGGTHPPQCLSSWKGEGSSIWSVSQIAAFNIDNVIVKGHQFLRPYCS